MTLARLRDGLRTLLELVVLALMASLAAVVVVGVVFRKAGASLVWYDEVASILLAWLTYYGAALAALHRAHIGMPTLVDRLPARARVAVVLVAETCVLAFFAVLAWAGLRVLSVLSGTSLVSLPWVPASVAQSVIPIGAILFIAAQLTSLPDALREKERDEDEVVAATSGGVPDVDASGAARGASTAAPRVRDSSSREDAR